MYQSDNEKLKKFFNKTTEDENKKKYRNHLVHLLGDKLSTADKFYMTVDELEKMVEKKFGTKKEKSEKNQEKQLYNNNNNKKKDELIYKTADKLKSLDNGVGIFARNYVDMIDDNTRGSDNYFHAKAACEAGQKNAKFSAAAMSYLKEAYDIPSKIIKRDGSIGKILKDSKKDLENDKKGFELGKKNSAKNCKDLVKEYRVKGINEKY